MKKQDRDKLLNEIYSQLLSNSGSKFPLEISSKAFNSISKKAGDKINLLGNVPDGRILSKMFSTWLVTNKQMSFISLKNKCYTLIDSPSTIWHYEDPTDVSIKQLKFPLHPAIEAQLSFSQSESTDILVAAHSGMFEDFLDVNGLMPPSQPDRSYFSSSPIPIKIGNKELYLGNIQTEIDGFTALDEEIIAIEAKRDKKDLLDIMLYKQIFSTYIKLSNWPDFYNKHITFIFMHHNTKRDLYYLSKITFDNNSIESFRVLKQSSYSLV